MMRRMLNPFLFCFALAVGSDYLTIREAFFVPLGKTFVYGHNAYADFFYYLSLIHEGTRGNILVSGRYTTEYFPPQFAQPFFTVTGYFGGMFGLTPPIIYFLSRIAGGTILLFLIYLAGKKLVGKYAFFSLLTVLFSVPMWFVKDGTLTQWCDFWTGFHPLYRITFLPHHLFANIFGFFALFALDEAVQRKRYLIGIGAILSLVISIFINPAIALLYAGTVVISLSVQLFRRKCTHYIVIVLIGLIISIVASYLYAFQTYSVPPWSVTSAERMLWHPIDAFRFLLVLGPMAILAFFTIITIRRWTFFLTTLSVWFFLPIGILFLFPYISSFLPIVMIRFVQSAPYIPTGILAAYGCIRMHQWLKKKPYPLKIVCISGVACIFLLAIPTYIINIIRIEKQFAYDTVHEPGFYIPNESYDVLSWLHIHGTPDETILAVEPVSYMIPAYTHLIIPVGALTNTNPVKRAESYEVFNFQTTPLTQTFIERERISYLLVYKNRLPTPDFIRTFGFEQVYSNAAYVVFHRNFISDGDGVHM